MEKKWSVVQIMDRYYYRDGQGVFSESYAWAADYCNGFALVQKQVDAPYQFRDVNGNLSDEFHSAYSYNDGFAIVRKGPIAPWQFRDAGGNLSEPFYAVNDYHNGLAKVQKNFGCASQYRDIYGNLYDSIEEARVALINMQVAQNHNETIKQPIFTQGKNNKNIEEYFKNEVTVYDLSPKDIYDNLEKIVDWEEYNCKLEMENAGVEMRDEIFERYSVAADYIKHTAYEYSEELKNEKSIKEYIGKLF